MPLKSGTKIAVGESLLGVRDLDRISATSNGLIVQSPRPALVGVWRLSGQNQVLLAAASWPTEDGD